MNGDELRADVADGLSLDERAGRANLWEAAEDERERLADERERLADERDALGDSREWAADRHESELDRREAEQAQSPIGAGNAASEPAAALAAVRRAEDGLRRAQARLRQARQAQDRVEAAASRRAAAEIRAGAAEEDRPSDGEERAWRAERRDFVAVDRDRIAGIREALADERDEDAAVRERIADERELAALDRERRLDVSRRGGSLASLPATTDHGARRDQRIRAERQRDDAAARRRSAATERARAAASWGPQLYGPMLFASFADLAKLLIASDDLGEVLAQVLKYSVGALDGCDHASVTLVHDSRPVDTVATSPIAAELDDLAFGAGLGPGPEALRSDTPIYVPDLTASRRWPVLTAAATQLDVASVLCLGLFAHQPARWTPLGTLTLYGAARDGYTEEEQEFASILAAYIAVAVVIAQRLGDVDRREAALHRGLSTRDVIGQAKGILMERQRLAAPDAFDLLRRASQSLNVKLADVARHLAETGEMPTHP